MTNKDYFLKDNVSVEEFCMAIRKNDIVKFEPPPSNVAYVDLLCLRGWLEDTTTPTLTEDERVILRNINNMCKTIYRGKYTGHIRTTLYCPQPDGLCGEELRCFDNLFQFIKERRRIRDSRTFERRINNER